MAEKTIIINTQLPNGIQWPSVVYGSDLVYECPPCLENKKVRRLSVKMSSIVEQTKFIGPECDQCKQHVILEAPSGLRFGEAVTHMEGVRDAKKDSA